jgi:hypothetical protein
MLHNQINQIKYLASFSQQQNLLFILSTDSYRLHISLLVTHTRKILDDTRLIIYGEKQFGEKSALVLTCSTCQCVNVFQIDVQLLQEQID